MGDFLLAFCSFLLLAIACVLLAPILCICEVFRQSLKICLRMKHKQRINLVDNAAVASLVVRTNTESIVNCCSIFQGTANLREMKNTVMNKWTNVMEKGQYKYPTLRQHIIVPCGYYFWLPDKNFSIDDHVQLYDCKPPKNQNELDDLCSEVSSQPLPETTSPWLILLFPLDKSFGNEPRYGIFFRFHHCMGDGYNLNRMMSRCILSEKSCNFFTPKPKSQVKISLTTLLTTFFYYPKYLLAAILTKDCNVLHGPQQTSKRFLRQMVLSSLPRVKEVAKATGATINDVMVSCVAGALKRYFAKYNAVPIGDVCSVVPVAMQRASEEPGFKNCISIFTLPLALKNNTAMERLKSTQQYLNKCKEFPFYLYHYSVVKLVFNRLPAQITIHLLPLLFHVTCIITNVPLQQSRCYNIYGEELLACHLMPVHNTTMGVGFAVSSLSGNMQLTVSVDKNVGEQEDVNTIITSFCQEFEELEKYVTN